MASFINEKTLGPERAPGSTQGNHSRYETRDTSMQEPVDSSVGLFTAGSSRKVMRRLWLDLQQKQHLEPLEASSRVEERCQLRKYLSFEQIMQVATSSAKGQGAPEQLKLRETPCSSKARELGKARAIASKEQDLRNSGLVNSCFTCSVCRDYFIDPVLLNCGHTFCCFCISEWTNGNNTCPVCREGIQTMTREITVRNFIDRLFENSPELKNGRKREQERRASILACRSNHTEELRHVIRSLLQALYNPTNWIPTREDDDVLSWNFELVVPDQIPWTQEMHNNNQRGELRRSERLATRRRIDDVNLEESEVPPSRRLRLR